MVKRSEYDALLLQLQNLQEENTYLKNKIMLYRTELEESTKEKIKNTLYWIKVVNEDSDYTEKFFHLLLETRNLIQTGLDKIGDERTKQLTQRTDKESS